MITTIGGLFKIEYGQKEFENKESIQESRGGNILISSKGDDNGVFGFFDIDSHYRAPFVTVPRVGTIGQAFVQDRNCAVDNNCMVLIPRGKLLKEELFQVAFQIRLNKWKYRYGRQITPERLSMQKIRLIGSKLNYEKLTEELLPGKNQKIKLLENKNIKLVKVDTLCNVQKRLAPPQNVLEENGTPYVTTTSKNNGVSIFANEDPNTKAKCLTVALNGSVGETFFQFDDFITSGDNAVITLKENYNPYLLFYIGAMIKNHQWRYNYYRKLNLTKLKKMTLPMPYKGNEVDVDYIKMIAENAYGFKELKKYL